MATESKKAGAGAEVAASSEPAPATPPPTSEGGEWVWIAGPNGVAFSCLREAYEETWGPMGFKPASAPSEEQ